VRARPDVKKKVRQISLDIYRMTHDLRGTPMNYFELHGTELKAKRSALPLYLASLVYTERLGEIAVKRVFPHPISCLAS